MRIKILMDKYWVIGSKYPPHHESCCNSFVHWGMQEVGSKARGLLSFSYDQLGAWSLITVSEKISRFSLKLSETNFSSQKDEKVRAVEFNYIAYRNLWNEVQLGRFYQPTEEANPGTPSVYYFPRFWWLR